MCVCVCVCARTLIDSSNLITAKAAGHFNAIINGGGGIF
jgi:hypothetical protein